MRKSIINKTEFRKVKSVSSTMSEEKNRDSKFSELIDEAKKSQSASDKKIKEEFKRRGLKF